MADCGTIHALLAGNICVFSPFVENLLDKILLSGRKLGDGFMQPTVLVLGGDLRLDIVIRGEQCVSQVKSVQGTMPTGSLWLMLYSWRSRSTMMLASFSETSTSTVSVANSYLIFMMCPFRLRRHLTVGTQKEPEVTMDTPADNTYKKA